MCTGVCVAAWLFAMTSIQGIDYPMLQIMVLDVLSTLLQAGVYKSSQ